MDVDAALAEDGQPLMPRDALRAGSEARGARLSAERSPPRDVRERDPAMAGWRRFDTSDAARRY
jgi:hypothetical protein